MVDRCIDVSVVIPAYREGINLAVLLPRLATVLTRAGLYGEIIVVDDASDDGTANLCARLSQRLPVRRLMRLEERCLASAIEYGLQRARGNILVVMNADMSHPPEKVPRLISICRSPRVDFVIGSRYVEGSSIDAAYPWHGKARLRIASRLLRSLTTARDPLSGFFAIKQTTLRKLTGPQSLGCNAGLEIIVRCDCRNIVEVPIAFKHRVFGRNSRPAVQRRQQIQQFARLYDAKYPGPARAIRFGLVGLSGTTVDLCAFCVFLLWAPVWVSRIAAIVCATLWNFELNCRFTFRAPPRASVLRQLQTYFGATLLGAAINCSVTVGLCATVWLFYANPGLAAVIGALAGAVVNYALCRRWVFQETATVHVAVDREQPLHESKRAA